VEQHQSYAYQIAYRIIRSQEDAGDVVQEAFIKVWKNLQRYKIRNRFTTWLYRIVVNTALDKLRQNKRRLQTTSMDANMTEIADAEKNPETVYIQQETRLIIQIAIDRLPEKQRMVFILRDLQELSIEEAAGILKCSHQNVKSHLYHARRAIRKMLIESEGE